MQYLLPIFYLLIGGTVTVMLVQRLVSYGDVLWLFLLVPAIMITVLLTVVGVANVWLQHKQIDLSSRRLLWLYLRSAGVVLCGLTIGVVFYWMADLLPVYIQDLLGPLRLLFYIMCVALTLGALASIVMSVSLHEERLLGVQNELQLIRAQLNPHFLYNTLNNIDALVWLDQEKASLAITELSDMLRYVTYSSRNDLVMLEEEMKHIRQLVELGRLRATHPQAVRLSDNIQESSETDSSWCRIPPLLLFPLVENCFKHCGSLSEPDAIVIDCQLINHTLVFSTDNSVKSETSIRDAGASRPGGVGLSGLQRRLELLYPGKYRFTTGVSPDGKRYKTNLLLHNFCN